MPRMIACQHCQAGVVVNDIGYGLRCDYCNGYGTIEDRRLRREPMVPLRLVEAIAVAVDGLQVVETWDNNNRPSFTLDGLTELDAAIRAAIETK